MLEGKSVSRLLRYHWSSNLPSTNAVTKVRLGFAPGWVWWIFSCFLFDEICSTELSLSVLEQSVNLCGAFGMTRNETKTPISRLSSLPCCCACFFKETKVFGGNLWLSSKGSSQKVAIGQPVWWLDALQMDCFSSWSLDLDLAMEEPACLTWVFKIHWEILAPKFCGCFLLLYFKCRPYRFLSKEL